MLRETHPEAREPGKGARGAWRAKKNELDTPGVVPLSRFVVPIDQSKLLRRFAVAGAATDSVGHGTVPSEKSAREFIMAETFLQKSKAQI